jgi:DNA-binding NarL/FixJ family response regulator/class 3 adenylate cyclase
VQATTDRRVAALLFTDIVGSTTHAARLGDQAWRGLLREHDTLVRKHLADHGGTEVDKAGDGFFAIFDQPVHAVECASRLVSDVHDLGIDIRVGVHTGECEFDGADVHGIGVHIAARIVELAQPNQVLVSQTVRDLTAGSSFAFTSAGRHTLRGVPGRWSLFTLGTARASAADARPRRRTTSTSASRSASGRPASGRPAQRGLRVLLVDDHPLWRETLGNVVKQARFTIVGEAETADEAVALAASKQPDIVIMDFELLAGDGPTATERIRAEVPTARVLFLSASDDRSNVVQALRAGANGYLIKTSRSAELIEALHRVHRGEVVLPPTVASYLLDELRGVVDLPTDPVDALASLTPREREILQLMAEGRSNQAICEALHLTVKTVEGHVSNVFMKLGLLPEPDTHRRVLAVVAYMRASGSA